MVGLLVVGGFGLAGAGGWVTYSSRDERFLLLGSIFCLFSMTIATILDSFLQHEGRLNWLTNQALWSQRQLQTYGLHLAPEVRSEFAQRSETHWPWGNHHTELLGHLEAAARKWWQLYDPASPDTAPTNDMVSEWLITDRGVSKDKAKAIASILRADGLRTGPR
jgi:hypothetical protein